MSRVDRACGLGEIEAKGTGAEERQIRSAGGPGRKDRALIQTLKAGRLDRLTDGGVYSMGEGLEVGRSGPSLGSAEQASLTHVCKRDGG